MTTVAGDGLSGLLHQRMRVCQNGEAESAIPGHEASERGRRNAERHALDLNHGGDCRRFEAQRDGNTDEPFVPHRSRLHRPLVVRWHDEGRDAGSREVNRPDSGAGWPKGAASGKLDRLAFVKHSFVGGWFERPKKPVALGGLRRTAVPGAGGSG